MDIGLWVVQGLLALAFAMGGLMKLTKPKDEIAEQMAWAKDFSQGTIRFIGAAELAGAIGIVTPWALGIAPILTPLAAIGLATIMFLAVPVHVRLKEMNLVAVNLVIAGLAGFVALGRFGVIA